jgi:phosphomannomutase
VLNSSACYQAVEMLTEAFRAAGQEQMDLTDGIRVDRDDGWVHVRPSRTEQIVRVISEAVDRETAENRARDVIRVIEQGI